MNPAGMYQEIVSRMDTMTTLLTALVAFQVLSVVVQICGLFGRRR